MVRAGGVPVKCCNELDQPSTVRTKTSALTSCSGVGWRERRGPVRLPASWREAEPGWRPTCPCSRCYPCPMARPEQRRLELPLLELS
jgi:hypothetical protein